MFSGYGYISTIFVIQTLSTNHVDADLCMFAKKNYGLWSLMSRWISCSLMVVVEVGATARSAFKSSIDRSSRHRNGIKGITDKMWEERVISEKTYGACSQRDATPPAPKPWVCPRHCFAMSKLWLQGNYWCGNSRRAWLWATLSSTLVCHWYASEHPINHCNFGSHGLV
jgi:hypothetical protein